MDQDGSDGGKNATVRAGIVFWLQGSLIEMMRETCPLRCEEMSLSTAIKEAEELRNSLIPTATELISNGCFVAVKGG